MSSQVSDFIFQLREHGELADQDRWLDRAQELVLARFGIKLSRNAIKKRYYRSAEKQDGLPNTEDSDEFYTESKNSVVAGYVTGDEDAGIDALCRRWNIDQGKWQVVRQRRSEWESPLGDTYQVLRSIRAEFALKEPAARWPTVRPLLVDMDKRKPGVASAEVITKTAIVCGDAHVWYSVDPHNGVCSEPYHDERAMEIVLSVIAHVQPTLLVLIGDMFDLPSFSEKFIRTPDMMFGFRPALRYMHSWLTRSISASPETKIVFIEGNHCKRISDSILRNMAAAYNLVVGGNDDEPSVMSIENLLGLRSLGVEYVGPYPDGRYWINDNLVAEHGMLARSGSGDTVKAILRETRHSVISGHTHRLESASVTVHPRGRARTYKAMSPGCLCHIDGRVPAQKRRQNWQQGFAYIEYLEGNEIFSDVLVNIYGGRCIFNGKIYQALGTGGGLHSKG